jgi:hypothetical protein
MSRIAIGALVGLAVSFAVLYVGSILTTANTHRATGMGVVHLKGYSLILMGLSVRCFWFCIDQQVSNHQQKPNS